MLDPIEGSHANPWQELKTFFADDLFGKVGTEMEQRLLARLTKNISKLVQKNGMACSSQDKEFIGSWVFNQDQALRSAKNNLLKSWRRSQSIETQKEDLHCTPTMHYKVQKPSGTDKLVTD